MAGLGGYSSAVQVRDLPRAIRSAGATFLPSTRWVVTLLPEGQRLG